ncbi:MAG TPA: alkaline phosphatase family protein [Bradyrhizobium sp.]|nr:alkaline phosphatase family protein [Bradyrhizobium sp.]
MPCALCRLTRRGGFMGNALANIQHVVVLMFENRSFDHLLGAMPGVDGVLDGQGNLKPDLYNTMNPLQAPDSNSNPATYMTGILPGVGTGNYESQYINNDINHEFGDGMMHDLFGPGATGIIGGQPQNAPAITFPPINSGFLSTPSEGINPNNGPGALTYFEWLSMQVFHTLAQSFVVCDAWYCDMPGHTAPNRAFMHCASTGDLGIDDNDAVGGTNMVNRLTIFERIQQKGQTWKMYWLGSNCDTNWLNEQVLSQQYNENEPAGFNVTNVPIANFFNDLTNGTLPFYSFIMCFNHGTDTSMHPIAMVEAGENFLACVYNALSQSSYWGNTLLIVNFDESGGIYDHKSLPATVAPGFDPNDGQQPPVWTWNSSITNLTYSFDFSVLGARIPVLLISPWLQAGVCNTQYQTTSILRFLQDLLPRPPNTEPYSLTQRDLTAPSIAPVFDYSQFGVSTMRTDCPSNIPGYTNSAVYPNTISCSELMSDPTPEQLAAVPAPHLVKMTRKYLGPLPGHPDSGKPLTRSFATVGEMRAYSKERMDAALTYIKPKQP